MLITGISFQNYRCFKRKWVGFDSFKPLNVIIGRNNTGKSHLLDLVESLCSPSPVKQDFKLKYTGVLDDSSLRRKFKEGTSYAGLSGDLWLNHGRKFVGANITWEINSDGTPSNLKVFRNAGNNEGPAVDPKAFEISLLQDVLKNASHNFRGSSFRRLLADRDIRPELPETKLTLSPNGNGATNIIRRYILTSNPKYPRELIQEKLLFLLNEIFGNDGHFTEIQVKLHDENDSRNLEGHWEIYLGEEKKGLIPLSSSGSGLKTVILVLINLLVGPQIGEVKSFCTFAFEELENNLHPALLRRLFRFLENYAITENVTIYLTTHSSVALDVFSVSKNAQIIHVTHDGEAATTTTVAAHFKHLNVISELGAKPSDLLQANGIIWVEGPSDRIYLNQWIDLFSGGKYKEGRDYQCAFYGGAILAKMQFTGPDEAVADRVNLFRINPNIVVVCDGDRTTADGDGSQFKERVQRIACEVKNIPGAHIWITEAKEVESYLPGSILGKVFDIPGVPDPEQYELFFPSQSSVKEGMSFVELHLKRKSIDKMELAAQASPLMTKDEMAKRFDLAEQINVIIDKIQNWNF